MSIRSQFRALEKRCLRPVFKKIRSSLSFGRRSGARPEHRAARIEELERRIDELERLVREDLGLRYLGVAHEGESRADRLD